MRLTGSIPQSKLLAAVLIDFAKKYPMVKILKIPGDQCIEGYPDKLMPTLLVYGPKEFRTQIVGLTELGGNNTRVSGMMAFHNQLLTTDLERYAESIGALSKAQLRVFKDKDEDEEYPEERNRMRKSVVTKNDEDDEWD